VTDPIDQTGRKQLWPDDHDKVVPAMKERVHTPDVDRAPWLADPKFGAVVSYSAAMIANPALRGSPAPTNERAAWPTLPAFPDVHAFPVRTSGCSNPLAAVGNAGAFADRGIPLAVALKDGAFGSAGDLEKFIDEYVRCTASRPELKALHEDALRVGPEILSRRLDTDEALEQRRRDEQQMSDSIAPLQLRAPLPVQQRAAVGEVAIPIAKVTTSVAKFVPMAGQLVVLAEVATGRGMMGLGEKLSNAERVLDAAFLIAPHAAKALGSGVRGAAEVLRMSRATGRSAEEIRVICGVAVAVQKNRVALREGLAAAQTGRALTNAERAALDAVGKSAESLPEAQALRRRTYSPTVTKDAALPAGEGWTDAHGNIGVSPHGTPKDVALALAHESVHSFLSPRALNGLREVRAAVGMTAYEKSALCRYLEEALAESYAQVKVNGPRGLPAGLAFPIRNGYVAIGDVAAEAVIGTIVYGGALYKVHVKLNEK
jgi:hypothetical protein